jgi:hypothetical protein
LSNNFIEDKDNIKKQIEFIKNKYNELRYNKLSLNEFWNILASFVGKLISNDNKHLIAKENSQKLRKLLNNISTNFRVREQALLEDDNDKVNTLEIKIRNRIDEIIDELNKLTFENNNSVKIYNDPSKKPISVNIKKIPEFLKSKKIISAVILVLTTAITIIFFLYDPQINHVPITENSFIKIKSIDNKIQVPLKVSDEDLNDILTINPVVKPRHASINQVDPNNKTVTLITEKGYSGIDSFSFFVKDQHNEKSNNSTSTFMINCDWNQTVKKLKVQSVKVTDIGYSLYSDTNLGIKFYYPNNWNISKTLKQGYTIGYNLSPAVNKNLEKPNPSLQILIHPLYEMSFETFLNNAFNSNFDVKYDDTPEFSKILFNDRCASEEYIVNNGFKAYSVKLLINDVVYNFLYWAPINEFDKYYSKILKIIGSIEVKK